MPRDWARGGLLGLALACSESGGSPSAMGGSIGGAGGSGADASSNPGSDGGVGGSAAAGAAGNPADPREAGASDAGADLVIASAQNQPTGIALDDSDVYWANHGEGTIVKCKKSGCGAGEPALVTSGYPGLHGIALRGSTLYWVTRDERDGGATSEVMKCDVNACGSGIAAEPNPGARGAFGPYGVAVNDERVYIAAWTELLSCPVTGCGVDPPTSHAVDRGITGVALGSSQIHVMRAGGSSITACPLAGCAGTEAALVSGITYALAFAGDGTSLYWSQYNHREANDLGGTIRACPLSVCEVGSTRVLVSGQIGAAGIAVDDSDVYYTDHLNGRVVRTSKASLSDACEPTHFQSCGNCGGLTRCDGSCSVATPADFDNPCGACGGTVQCDGTCSPTECP